MRLGLHKYPALLPFIFLASGIAIHQSRAGIALVVIAALLGILLIRTVFYALVFVPVGFLLAFLHTQKPMEPFVGKRIRIAMTTVSPSIARVDSLMTDSGMVEYHALVGVWPPAFEKGTKIDAIGFVAQTDNDYLIGNGVFHTFDVEHLHRVTPPPSLDASLRRVIGLDLQENIGDSLARGVLLAFTIGERRSVPFLLRENFKKAGIYHLFAISGLHIGILFTIFLLILRFLRVCKSTASVISGILLLGYGYVVGYTPSILRAVVMAWAFILAYVSGRRSYPINTLALAGLITLFINPFYLFNIGFQLSYLATFGILLFYPLYKNLPLRWLTVPLMASFAAMAYTAPILSLKMGYFSTVSPITSYIGGWLLWLALAETIAALATGMTPFYRVAELAASLLILTANLFAKLPFSTVSLNPAVSGVILWYVLLTAIGMALRIRIKS